MALNYNNVYYQDATPTPERVGDRWINSSGVVREVLQIVGSTVTWGYHFTSNTNAAMAGDVTLTAAGVSAIGTGKVLSAMIDPQVIQVASVSLTNAQIKALRATPVTVVAAAGAGKVIIPVSATIFMAYGGTNAFTAAANDNFGLKLKDGTTASLLTGGVQAFVQATNSAFSQFVPAVAAGSSVNISKANSDNQPLVVHNITAGEIAGNAAADNTMLLHVRYKVVTLTW